jgi:hypothetical protein
MLDAHARETYNSSDLNPLLIMKELLLALNGIVLTATFLIVAWTAAKVWDMNPKVVNTEVRVERIVDILPEVRVRIAEEDLSRKIPTAIVTTEPVMDASGQWVNIVHLVNFSSGMQTSYLIPLKGPNDLRGRYLVSGFAQDSSRQRVSFQENLQSIEKTGSIHPIPVYVDRSASWIFFKEKKNMLDRMSSAFGKPVSEQKIPKYEFMWPQLMDELSKNEAQYRISP